MPEGRGHATLDNPGLFVKPDIRYDFRYFSVGYSIGPRDQQAVTAVDDGSRDAGNLFGGLALTKHDLGEALADGAVVIDPREPQIFERLTIRPCQIFGAPLGVDRIEPAITDGVEERAKRVHWSGDVGRGLGRLRHGFSFDSAETPYLELRIVPRRRSLIL